MSDNPQAYPCLDSSGYGLSMRDPGMTLRDYFAGQAIFAGLDWTQHHETGGYAEVAAVAYEIADAMLTERSKATKETGQ